MDGLIIFGAKYLVWIVAVLFLAYFFFARRRTKRKLFLLSLISLPLAYIVGWVAGHFYYNPRPFVESGIAPLVAHAANNGFPSDHMLFAATLASLVFVFNRRLGLALWVLAILVGISRVMSGVHHSIDIVAGGIIAVVVVSVVYLCIRHARWYRG